MRERGWGRIVNVGSTSTREPIPGLNLSNSHRMAAIGFLKTLSLEVAGDGITVNTVLTGRFATERLAGEDGSLEGAEEAARTQVPAGRLGTPGGVRRPRRLPLLRARRLHHRHHDPDRRRRPPLVLLGATDGPLPPRPLPRGQRRRRPRQALDRAGADPRPDGGRGGRRVHRRLARAPLRRRPHAHRRGRDRALHPRPAPRPAPARRRDDLRPQTGRDPLRPGQRGDAPGPRRR